MIWECLGGVGTLHLSFEATITHVENIWKHFSALFNVTVSKTVHRDKQCNRVACRADTVCSIANVWVIGPRLVSPVFIFPETRVQIVYF